MHNHKLLAQYIVNAVNKRCLLRPSAIQQSYFQHIPNIFSLIYLDKLQTGYKTAVFILVCILSPQLTTALDYATPQPVTDIRA